MGDLESYRIAVLLLMLGWGFNLFALCTNPPRSVHVFVLTPMVFGAVLVLDSITFDLLRIPVQTVWFWLWGVDY